MDDETMRQAAHKLLLDAANAVSSGDVRDYLSYDLGIDADNADLMRVRAYVISFAKKADQ